MTPARARRTGLLVLAVLLAVGAAVLGGDGLRDLFDAPTRSRPIDATSAPLTADAPESEGPRLEGGRRPGPPASVPAETARGPVAVRVSDRSGRAVEGVHVVLPVPDQLRAAQEGVTDSAGRFSFAEDVPYDGTTAVSATSRDEEEGVFLVSLADVEAGFATPGIVSASALGTGRVSGPDVAITIDVGLPLEVDARNASDGRSVAVRWTATPRLEWAEETSDRATVPIGKRGRIGLRIAAVAPAGSAAEPSETWSLHVHPKARRLLAVVPVRPEVEVVAQFPPEVLPFSKADWHPELSVAGRPLGALDLSVHAGGRIGIAGVPFFPGEHVVIGGSLDTRFTTSGEGTLGGTPRATLVIPVACEEPPVVTGISPEFFYGVRHTVDLSLVTDFRLARPESVLPVPSPATGAVNVRVWLPSGSPAAGAHVYGGSGPVFTDAEGRAQVFKVPAGPARFTAYGAGAITSVHTEVKAGETIDLDLRTTAGGIVEVEVADVLGQPLPFAKLTIWQPSNLPWMDLDGDVQRVDPYTDVHGKRTLRMLETGVVGVTASYGSRSAKGEVTSVDGQTARLRLVLHHPEPKEVVAEGAPPPAPPGVVEPVEAER